MLFADDGKRLASPPRRVAILGMGPTLSDFVMLQLRHPGPGEIFDEVWGMNNVCTAIRCDVGFIMDDFVEMLEKPEKDSLFWDASNPSLMRWARDTKMQLVTSKRYAEKYPTTVEYPLKDVLLSIFGKDRAGEDGMQSGFCLSNTTSYAIAMAWHLGVKEIHLYGCDFAYPWHDPYDRRKFLEESRANVESLLFAGFMLGKFTFHMSARTSLFDTMKRRPFYGYADKRLALPDNLLTTQQIGDIANDTRIIPGEPLGTVGGSALAAAAAAGKQQGAGTSPGSLEGHPIQAIAAPLTDGHDPAGLPIDHTNDGVAIVAQG